MKNKNAFTLIELIAVIVILGLLLAIAIPNITKYITQSRKKTVVSTIGSYISSLVVDVNQFNYSFTGSNTIYAVPIECIALERGGTSPFGSWHQANDAYWAYVLVQYNKETSSYMYGYTFKDSAGYGLFPTTQNELNPEGKQIKNQINLSRPKTGKAKNYASIDEWNGFNVNSSTYLVVLKSKPEGELGDGSETCTLFQKGNNYDEIEQEKELRGIYITNAKYAGNVAADFLSSMIVSKYQTTFESHIVLSKFNKNSSITYEITIYNSYSEDYAFDKVDFTLGEDTYDNENITYELNGLKYGDIIHSKESITFTITFHYENYENSNNNVLNSILNFNFKRFYNVTYENFTSTSSYPKIVLLGQNLTIPFVPIEEPIEVKKSNEILNSSDYSYLNNVLTINSVNGDIHIRKLKKYTIKNMIKNGSFEDGINEWTIVGNQSFWHKTNNSYFGSNAYQRDSSVYGYNYLKQIRTFTNGHKYYLFVYSFCSSEQVLLADVANNKDSAIDFKHIPNVYNKGSSLFTSDFTGDIPVHVNFEGTNDAITVDGIGLIDLTAAFGLGNEPSKTWCDNNIDYFDGTKVVYK